MNTDGDPIDVGQLGPAADRPVGKASNGESLRDEEGNLPASLTRIDGHLALRASNSSDEIVTSNSELPPDFYVSLRPLTLGLLAQQFERLDLRFREESDCLLAEWADFQMQARVLAPSTLAVRCRLTARYPALSIGSVVARCNWWNAFRSFLKASAGVVPATISQGGHLDADSLVAVVIVHLDLDLPLPVGIAPVQLQSIINHVIANVSNFQTDAALDHIVSSAAW